MLNGMTFKNMWVIMYLNIAQAFLQVGNHFRELGPVLKWKIKPVIFFCFNAEQSQASGVSQKRQTHVFSLKHCPVCCAHFSPPTHEAKVNSASKAVLRSLASL